MTVRDNATTIRNMLRIKILRNIVVFGTALAKYM